MLTKTEKYAGLAESLATQISFASSASDLNSSSNLFDVCSETRP